MAFLSSKGLMMGSSWHFRWPLQNHQEHGNRCMTGADWPARLTSHPLSPAAGRPLVLRSRHRKSRASGARLNKHDPINSLESTAEFTAHWFLIIIILFLPEKPFGYCYLYCAWYSDMLWMSIKKKVRITFVQTPAQFLRGLRGSVPGLGGSKETKNVSSPSTCESQYCGEPPWPRGSVLGLRPPGLELRILCLEDSVISIISPSSGGSPGPV